MEISTEKIKDYLIALKDAGKFTLDDVAKLSGTPLQTVKNIYSGKTPDSRFGTVARIVLALGGDLNDLVGNEKRKEIEANSTLSMKETYETRIADVVKHYEQRIEDIKALCEIRIADIQKCYEFRIADMKRNYEERIADHREMFQIQKWKNNDTHSEYRC